MVNMGINLFPFLKLEQVNPKKREKKMFQVILGLFVLLFLYSIVQKRRSMQYSTNSNPELYCCWTR